MELLSVFIDPLIKKETTKKPQTGNTGIQGY